MLLGTQAGISGSKDLPEHVLEVPSLHEVPLQRGRQTLPDVARPGSAAGLPIMKERAQLQVRAFVAPVPLHSITIPASVITL